MILLDTQVLIWLRSGSSNWELRGDGQRRRWPKLE